MPNWLINTANLADQYFARQYLRWFRQEPSLMVLVFHSLFRDKREIEAELMFLHEGILVEQFRLIITYFLQQEFLFVTPADIQKGLDPSRYHLMLTFDDGYYNNHRAVPILQEYDVPAVFHISTGYVTRPRSFWWDGHYRARRAQGWAFQRILAEQNELKALPFAEVEAKMIDGFGKKSMEPTSDTDRPFTAAELRDFASQRGVWLGNHTQDHAILPHYSSQIITHQLQQSQATLASICGYSPTSIAYPNGNYSPEVQSIAEAEGLSIGLTGIRKKHYHKDPLPRMEIGRVPLFGIRDIPAQCDNFRSDRALKWLKN